MASNYGLKLTARLFLAERPQFGPTLARFFEMKMQPTIIEDYTDIGVDVGHIVRRILSHLSPEMLEGLHEIRILDRHEKAFGCYIKGEGAIEIYAAELLGGFSPVFLKICYPFTYAVIGMAVGHELDHHVTRNTTDFDREVSAETNFMKYIYPSFGVFKPFVRIVSYLGGLLGRSSNQRTKKLGTG